MTTLKTLAGWLILANFCFSCAGLTVREDAPAGLVLFVVAWFIVSSALMRWAYRRGMLEMLNRITGEMK
jgi:hypothetical protein